MPLDGWMTKICTEDLKLSCMDNFSRAAILLDFFLCHLEYVLNLNLKYPFKYQHLIRNNIYSLFMLELTSKYISTLFFILEGF